jgi:hypothetical protein
MCPAPVRLATLDVCLLALFILLLTGILASVRAIRTRVRLAVSTVWLCVQFEGSGREVLLDVIARHQGKRDTANGVAGAIVVLLGGWLLADVGWLGDG